MELFHIHRLGIHDELYVPDTEILIDPETFDNGLCDRIKKFRTYLPSEKYQFILEDLYRKTKMKLYQDSIPAALVADYLNNMIANGKGNNRIVQNAMINYIKDMVPITQDLQMNLREQAMEEFRIKNCPEKPSRLHSLFACDDSSLDYWIFVLGVHNIQDYHIYNIEVDKVDFISSQDFLPSENLSYEEKVIASRKYFYPQNDRLNTDHDEYLIQGRVRIKDRII